MKRIRLLSFVVVGLMTMLTTNSVAKPIVLNFSTHATETGWSSVNALRPWVKQIENATNGKVKINIYYNQTLVKGTQAWKSVKNRIVDMAWCFHGYWPGLTPLADVVSLPGLPFNNAEKRSEILWKMYKKHPEIEREFEDNKVLLLHTSEPFTLITRKNKINGLKDIKGLKIRVTGGPPTTQIIALGGVPVAIPMSDCYIALQKGVIEGMGTAWDAIHSFRLHEVVEHYTEVPLPAVYFSIAINKNVWNRFSPDIKEAIMSVSGLKGSKFWGANSFDSAKIGLMNQLESMGRGITINTLTDSERKKWIEVSGKPVWNQWVDKMEKQGHHNAQEILNSALEMK